MGLSTIGIKLTRQRLTTASNNILSLDKTRAIMKHDLLEKLEQAREKYKPAKIDLLLVAEAAPDSLDRFFYYEDVKSEDFLFLGVVEVLNPALKEAYLRTGRNSEAK